MIRKTLHLLLFSLRLTLLELSWKFDRSLCRDNASDFELMVLKILVSSANVAILELVTALDRFSYRRNSSGPRMDPCGTPDDTGSGLETAPRTVVC